jgi:Transposase
MVIRTLRMPESPEPTPASKRPAIRGHRFGEKDFEVLIGSLSEGRTITEAAKATGFNRATVYEWFGRNPNKHDELKRRMKPVYLARVQELGEVKEDWRAYAWMLERMFPNEFALTEVHRVEHSGAVEHQVKMLPESELLRMVERAAAVDASIDNETHDGYLNGNGAM